MEGLLPRLKDTVTLDDMRDRVARYRNQRVTVRAQIEWMRSGHERDAIASQAGMILAGHRRLITISQTKLSKASDKTTYRNYGLTLSPADEARAYIAGSSCRWTMCPGASEGCIPVCVGSETGQGRLDSSKIARIGRTLAYYVDPLRWWTRYTDELTVLRRRAHRAGDRLAFRANVASDSPRLAAYSRVCFPDIEWYDYTVILPALDREDGVHRVYSLKENRIRQADKALSRGHGVAVVYRDQIPDYWRGHPVINGDVHDLFWLQARDARMRAYGTPDHGAYVVGLKLKGHRWQREHAIRTGFAQ